MQFPASLILLGPNVDALLVGIHVRDAMMALIHVELGTTLPTYIGAVTQAACADPDAKGVLRAPAAPLDVTPGDGRGGDFFADAPWLTETGARVPSCNTWAVLPDAELDSYLVPQLH